MIEYRAGGGTSCVGIITYIREGFSVEEHGTIEIEIIGSNGYYLGIGELEHFVYFNWQQDLRIIR